MAGSSPATGRSGDWTVSGYRSHWPLGTSLSVARNHMPVRPRKVPARAPAKIPRPSCERGSARSAGPRKFAPGPTRRRQIAASQRPCGRLLHRTSSSVSLQRKSSFPRKRESRSARRTIAPGFRQGKPGSPLSRGRRVVVFARNRYAPTLPSPASGGGDLFHAGNNWTNRKKPLSMRRKPPTARTPLTASSHGESATIATDPRTMAIW
jgi:hypothetical protein